MTQTIPECLTRTAADDRAEARIQCLEARLVGASAHDAALAAIQRREAEAVLEVSFECFGPKVKTLGFTEDAGLDGSLLKATRSAAVAAKRACAPEKHYGEPTLTLDQRATLLDAARALVRLALEVAS